MPATLLSLGSILFTTPYPFIDGAGFETISREMMANVTAQPRLGRDNAVQFTGPGEEVISIHGRVFPYMFGGLNTMEQLRMALRAGQPMALTQFSSTFSSDTSLTSGLTYGGILVGNYMIKGLKKQSSLFTGNGVPMKVDFTLDIVLYGDDA